MVEENPIKQTNRAENPSKQIAINFSCSKPTLSSGISIQIPPNKRALSQIGGQVPPSKKPKKTESFEKEPKKCSEEVVTGNYSLLKQRLLSGSSNQRALPQIQRTLPYQCLHKKCLEQFHNKGHLSKHIELYHPGHIQNLTPVPLQEDELINLQNQTAASTPTKIPLTTSIASAIPQATVISNNTRASTSSSSNEGSENKFLQLLPRHPVQHEELVASGFSLPSPRPTKKCVCHLKSFPKCYAKIHRSNYKFLCDVCTKSFESQSKLDDHYSKHTGREKAVLNDYYATFRYKGRSKFPSSNSA